MATLKKLASQTAVYGLTTILARMLHFALTPLHTAAMAKAEYGVLNDLYSLIAFLMVILTFGMETAFFRFYHRKDASPALVFSHTLGVTLLSSLGLLLVLSLFHEGIAEALRFRDNPQYLWWMVLIVAMDAIAAVPLAKLRADNRPMRFLRIRLSAIALMVALNLVFFLLLPWCLAQGIAPALIERFYTPGQGAAYVLQANLIGNAFMLLLFIPDFRHLVLRLDRRLLYQLLLYASPLVLGFLAGIANEKAQYQFMKYLLPADGYREAQGVFGAMMKIATFMVLFVQAFRFAAEPFFFSQAGTFRTKMAQVMRYFVIAQSLIFLGLVCFTKVLQWTHFIAEKHWEGWHIVPILLFANLLLGINFNLNIWYKLQNKTRMGAYISFFGLAFTIVANLLLVPDFGYTGAAWATLISYGAMTILAYALNQKYDKVDYPLGLLLRHLALALALAYISFYLLEAALLWGSLIFLLYLLYLAFSERKILRNLWILRFSKSK